MPRRYHLPTVIRWSDDAPSGESLDRESIGEVVLSAMERALADAPGGASAVHRIAGLDEQPAARFDPARLRADRSGGDDTYSVPSFGHGGEPVDLAIRSARTSAGPRRNQTPSVAIEIAHTPRLPHAHAAADQDRFLEPPSPFDGRPLLEVDGHSPIVLGGGAYGRYGSLRRAVDHATLALDGLSFAVLEGPYPIGPESRYVVVPTATPISDEALDKALREHWRLEIRDTADSPYLVRAIVSREGDLVAPPDSFLHQELTIELAAARPAVSTPGVPMSPPAPRMPTPAPLMSPPARPARPTDTGMASVLHLEAPTRLAWLEALLAGPLDREDRATAWQLLGSFGDRESLGTALVSLQRSGRLAELAREPDRALWLLLHVGTVFERADEPTPFDLVALFEQAGLPFSSEQPTSIEFDWIDVAWRHFGPAEGLEAGLARVLRLAGQLTPSSTSSRRETTLSSGASRPSGDAARAWRGLSELRPNGPGGRRLAWLVVWALAAELEPIAGETLAEPWPIALIVES